MEQSSVSDLLRPFLWLFVVGFLLGFGGYLALGGGVVHASGPPDRTQPQAVSEVDAGALNAAKPI
jgi:hypothetical protein